MAITSGILGTEVNFDKRLVDSLDSLEERVESLRKVDPDLRIVLTSGSFDLIHLGHVKYLARAKALGEVLIVGVDSDEKIRLRKGEDRPLVPEAERLEMLAHQRPVDLVFLKEESHERWDLIKAVRPDVLVVSADNSYGDEEKARLREFCGEIRVIERQADVTTSERIRQLYMHLGDRLGPKLAEVLPGLIDSILKRR